VGGVGSEGPGPGAGLGPGPGVGVSRCIAASPGGTAGSGLIGSSGVSGPFGSGCGASGGLGSGCSGGLGAGTSAVSGIVIGDTLRVLLFGYERHYPIGWKVQPADILTRC